MECLTLSLPGSECCLNKGLIHLSFLAGLYCGHVFPAVLARQKTGVWQNAKSRESCSWCRIHPSDLDTGHFFCQWKNSVFPRSHHRKPILAHSPRWTGAAKHSVSKAHSAKVSVFVLNSFGPTCFLIFVGITWKKNLHMLCVKKAHPSTPKGSILLPQNECFGCMLVTLKWV